MIRDHSLTVCWSPVWLVRIQQLYTYKEQHIFVCGRIQSSMETAIQSVILPLQSVWPEDKIKVAQYCPKSSQIFSYVKVVLFDIAQKFYQNNWATFVKKCFQEVKKSPNLVTLSTVSVLWNNVSKGSALAKLAEQWIPEPDRTTAVWPDLAIFERSWQQILLQKLPNYLATVLSIFKDIPLLGNFSKYLAIFYSYIWSRRGSNRQFYLPRTL